MALSSQSHRLLSLPCRCWEHTQQAVGQVSGPILEVRTLRFRKVKFLDQGRMDNDMSRIPPALTEPLSSALLPKSCCPHPRRDECPPKREALRQELGMGVRGTGTPVTLTIPFMTKTPTSGWRAQHSHMPT